MKKKSTIKFPSQVLIPVKVFLKGQLKELEKRRKHINDEDPFNELGRAVDNAAPDTDAAEQFGHARASAISSELERKIIQTKKALSRIKIGKYGVCTKCGKMIDTDRLVYFPEATLCITCGKKKEEK